MIRVVIKRSKKSDKITSITVKGHANSAPHGKDLVCAAVSAIVLGGFSSLDDKNFEFVVKEGYSEASSINEVSDHDSVVLETILMQLKVVENDSPDYVKIEKD